MRYEDIKVGDRFVNKFYISKHDVDRFIHLTEDTNTVHETIVHGMLSASFIGTMIGTQIPGNGALITSHNIRFIRPIEIDSRIVVICEVNEKKDGSIKLWSDIFNQYGGVCVSSTAWVKILEQ